MKTRAPWIKLSLTILAALTLAATTTHAFPSFLKTPNDFLTLLTPTIENRIFEFKKTFPYEKIDNRLLFDVSDEESPCTYGRNIVRVDQTKTNNIFTAIIHIEECEEFVGTIEIIRKGQDLKAAKLEDLLAFRLPPITTENFYQVIFPNRDIVFKYTHPNDTETRLSISFGAKEEDFRVYLDYTEHLSAEETLRSYQATFPAYNFDITYTALKIKRPNYYELNLTVKEDHPLGLQDFYDGYNELFHDNFKNIAEFYTNFFQPPHHHRSLHFSITHGF